MNVYCIYLRKSRLDSEAEARGEGETLSRHRALLTELAQRRGLNIVKTYEEVVSGESISARPQMQMLLSDIKENKYTGVLVAEIERLARGDTADQGTVAKAFKESHTKIITPVKTYDPDNPVDEEYFEFSLFMSRMEYRTIKRRLESGRIQAIKEGNYIYSGIPFGYRKVNPAPKVHTLEKIESEAETIRLIYRLYMDGHGAGYISGELNRLGIRPQKSETWETASIRKILSNPVYCGKICRKNKSGGLSVYQGKHEPIITEEIFNAVQEKRKSKPVVQLRKDDILLNYYHGILFCNNCKHQMRRRFIAENGHQHILCSNSLCRGAIVGATFEEVDRAVLCALRYRAEKLSVLSYEGGIEHGNFIPNMQKPIKAELDKAEKQLERAYELLESGIYGEEIFLERSAILKERIKTLKKSLDGIIYHKEVEKTAGSIKVTLQYVIDNFENSTPEKKNEMLKSLIKRIYYTKTKRNYGRGNYSDLTLEIDFM